MVQKKFKPNFNIKFSNCLMRNGEKQISENIIYNFLIFLLRSSNKNIKNILKFSLLNVTPIINIYSNKRKKRIINEIPFLVNQSLRINKAIKIIIKNARSQSNKFFLDYLNNEIIQILKKNSTILTYKNDLYNYAFKKKAFSHFRWF